MAIFGINFNDFGSRKLKIDSQKNGEVNFEGRRKQQLLKYAPPVNPDDDLDKKPVDDLPTVKYGIPSENFLPYIHIKPPIPTKTIDYDISHAPMVKYGYPPED